ncbi:MAG: type II toxin-antitoxin system VapC family toxin [Elusimicrobia bacterium]|nr:type II toxin-antitoxin system VapC family toxin [Elusimicrobiota bacterium]
MDGWPERVFCDTSFFFASLDRRDLHHVQALRWAQRSARAGTAFWCTWDVVGETVTLLRRKAGYREAAGFLQRVLPGLHLVPCDDSMREETAEVFLRLGRDKKLSWCDCMSFVAVTTVLDRVPTATFDVHFKSMGLPVLSD